MVGAVRDLMKLASHHCRIPHRRLTTEGSAAAEGQRNWPRTEPPGKAVLCTFT